MVLFAVSVLTLWTSTSRSSPIPVCWAHSMRKVETRMRTNPGRSASDRQELRDRRLQRGLSQRQLATRVGVDVQTISRWEAGRSVPQSRHVLSLCEALGTDGSQLAHLLGRNVVPLRAGGGAPQLETSLDPTLEDLRAEFLRAAFSALARGDASTAEWRRSAKAVAREVGLAWAEDTT